MVVVAGTPAPGGAGVAGACPTIGAPTQAGSLGRVPGETNATVGISGLGVSRYNANAAGAQIAWAVGDRSANEIAGTDRVFLFGLDARDGSLAIRYPLAPGDFEDDPREPSADRITNLAQTANPIPDFEELSIDYPSTPSQAGLWMFDTGDNSGSRPHVNAYVVKEPDLMSDPSHLGTHPGLDDALTGPTLSLMRYPIRLMNGNYHITANVEAAFIDPRTPGNGADAVYLITKSPVDRNGDGARGEFRVFKFHSRLASDSGQMNIAKAVGWIDLGHADLKVTSAAVSEDGTSFVVRAVSGGSKADLDVVAMWNRTAGATIEQDFEARHVPDCTWSLNSAPGSSIEETIAYRVRPGGGWDGFVWTHDVPKSSAPYFTAAKT